MHAHTPIVDRATSPDVWTVRFDGSSCDPARLGGKGAALDRLVRWGLPVPPTGAVTADAYRCLAGAPAVAALVAAAERGDPVAAERVDAAFLAAPWPDALDDAVVALARTVGDGHRVAVRSSATVEDLAASSFAGQYRSVLDVDPADADAVRRAVRLVFASLWHPAPCAYRRAFGIGAADAAMAAVVMRMVPARRAGVVFTVDPATDADHARVEHVEGLGDALVSGRETPVAHTVPRADAGALDAVAARALTLALAVEAHAGAPQDVEWAWDGDAVWLVQARPITGAGDLEDGIDDPPARLAGLDLTTAAIGEMLPGVLPPLVWGVDRHLVEESFRRLLDGLGVLPDDLVDDHGLLHRVRGRAAIDFARLRAMSDALPGAAGGELEQQYFGSGRADRPAAAAGPRARRRRAAVHDLRVLAVRGRAVFDAELAIAAATIVAALDAEGASDPPSEVRLLARHTRLVDLAARTMAAELAVAADAAALHRRLELVLTRAVGAAAAGPLAARLVTGAGLTATVGPDASAAVVAGPTWAELGRTPPPGGPTRPAAEHAAAAVAAVTVELGAGRPPDHWRTRLRARSVRRLTTEVVEQLRRREATKAALLTIGGALRRTHLELGRRLAARGVLGDAAEVELLTPLELRRAVTAGVVPPVDARRRRRRALQRDAQDGPLPVRFCGVPPRVPVAVPAADRVEGWAASRGRFVGVARVVRDPADRFDADEVLVAPATDPSWSPLFVRAGAIVLERGGPLSHAAILARELGVPAVLNVPGACARFDGRRVLVDGDAGVVAIVDDGTREEPHQEPVGAPHDEPAPTGVAGPGGSS